MKPVNKFQLAEWVEVKNNPKINGQIKMIKACTVRRRGSWQNAVILMPLHITYGLTGHPSYFFEDDLKLQNEK